MQDHLTPFMKPPPAAGDKGAAEQGYPHEPSSWYADGGAMSRLLTGQMAISQELSRLVAKTPTTNLNTAPLDLTAMLKALPKEHREFVECVDARLAAALTGSSSSSVTSSVGDLGEMVPPASLPAWAAANSRSPEELERRHRAHAFADQLLAQSSAGCLPAMNNLCSRAAGNMVRAGSALVNLLQSIGNGDFASTLAQFGSSAGQVHARNVAAVMIPTFLRHFVATGVEAALEHLGVNDKTKAAIGLMVSLAPVAAQVAGAIRDHGFGTATATSQRSRAIMGGTTLLAALAAAGSGMIAKNAANLLCMALYTFLRDVMVQSRLRLNNPDTEGQEPTPGHWAAISVGYGVDQMLVSMGMTAWAPQAGASARIESWRDLGVSYLHAGIRALLNLAGENAEDLMFQSYPALASLGNGQETHGLNLNIEDVDWQEAHVMNGALGGWAVRTGIIASTINSLALLEKHVFENGADLSETSQNLINHALVGIINGVLYHPFATASAGQPSAADLQAARAAVAALRPASAAEATADASLGAATDGRPPAGGRGERVEVVVEGSDTTRNPVGAPPIRPTTGSERRPEATT
jgi:hypothetical protein